LRKVWSLPLLHKYKRPLLVPDDHADFPIPRHIPHRALRSHARIIVNLVRDKLHLRPLAHELKPIQHRRPVRVHISMRPMRPPAPPPSYAYICAPPSPKFASCFFHTGSPASDAGCSHHPPFSRRSSLWSPFTSPTPKPCVKR